MEKKFRTLIIAEAANPEWESVPLIGWSLYRALAEKTNAHLITHVRNRDAIARAGLTEGKHFTAIDTEWLARPVWKIATKIRGGDGKGWTTMSAFSALSYYAFEHAIWGQFKDRLKDGEFDLVHRITPLSPTHQSLLASRLAAIKVPFVLGPLNGGVPWPKQFRCRQQAEREWLSSFRNLYKCMPAYKSTLSKSSAIIAGSKFTQSQFPSSVLNKCIYIPENGIDPKRFQKKRARQTTNPLRAAFLGRLVPYKGADILLRAASRFIHSGQLQLDIIGDGPQRDELESLTKELSLDGHVKFHGWVAHRDVQNLLRESDFLALPSIREFGGGVVLEAMALGVPPVVANYAGPSELVDNETGIRVEFDCTDSLCQNFEKAIQSLVDHPERIDAMGTAGKLKVSRAFTWSAKANQILELYEAITSNNLNPSRLGLRPASHVSASPQTMPT